MGSSDMRRSTPFLGERIQALSLNFASQKNNPGYKVNLLP